MKFQGDISSIPITDVVQNLSANLKSGVLTIRRGDECRQVILREGRIASYGDNSGFSIVSFFRDKGYVDPEIFSKAEKRYKKAKRKSFGEIAHDLDGIDLETYNRQVREIVQDMLYETFSFRDGAFEFDESAIDLYAFDRELATAKLDFSVRSIVMEAARRMDDWDAIRRSLPSENDIFHIVPTEMGHVEKEFSEDSVALTIAELLDGTRSIREVIAAAPAGRFVASKVVADLVSRKIARPIDGNELVKQLAGGTPSIDDNMRALIGLKAALEREPGNRSLLEKIAELSVATGHSDEAAVYHKLVAQSLLDEDNLADAKTELRRSLELNGKDLGTWQKLYDITEQEGDNDALRQIGLEMVKHLRSIGLNELARDQLGKMLKIFPGDTSLRMAHADTLFALGDRGECVKRLLDLARDLYQAGKAEQAEKTLAKVIEYDPNHQRAREIYEKVRTGTLEKERKQRRRVLRVAAVCAVVTLFSSYIGYDLFARKQFAHATSEVFAAGLDDRRDYIEARKTLEAVKDRYPLSLLHLFEARDALKAIDQRLGANGE